jgi:RNA polymerase sigma-54 factor
VDDDTKLKLSQQLVMTPQLQQAIRMLSQNLEELLRELDATRKKNPMLSVQTRTTRPIGPFPPDLETIPEVYVYLQGGDVFVEPNINALPDIFIGNILVPQFDPEDDSAASPLDKVPAEKKEQAREVLWLARAVQQRAKTYVSVIRAIVMRGPPWFKDEDNDPPKFTVREIAEEVGMHESTISRILTGEKVLRCERGLLRFDELKKAKRVPRLAL